MDLTDRLIQVGKIVNIPVVEHLIIKRLEKSKKYVPGYLEVERIQKEARRIGEEIGEQKGMEKGLEKVAKEMKKKGEPIEKISEYTGLSKEEIEQFQIKLKVDKSDRDHYNNSEVKLTP